MLAKLNLMKPLVFAGAVAAALVTASADPAEAVAAGPTSTTTGITHYVAMNEPGGSGCDANGNCGSGGVDQGPNGGTGGTGCIPGVGCGTGGQFFGPGGVPGGEGCLPGVGCGSGHA